MSEPALKCENNAILKQCNTLKLFFAFIIAYSCCFCIEENLDFRISPKYSFITLTTGHTGLAQVKPRRIILQPSQDDGKQQPILKVTKQQKVFCLKGVKLGLFLFIFVLFT